MRRNTINTDKNAIITEIILQLQQELALALLAAENAYKAATDDQSVAETQYDTLAIEQSYLAEGQSRRVAEISQAIKSFENLDVSEEKSSVMMGSLVQMEQDMTKNKWFFIAPAAGGQRCQITGQDIQLSITVITPQSPMGEALLGKELDDEVVLSIGRKQICDFITDIR